MSERLPEEIIVIVPVGMLGGGVTREQVRYGIEQGAHAIAGRCGFDGQRASVSGAGCVEDEPRVGETRPWRFLLRRRIVREFRCWWAVAGTSGTDSGVDWTRDIVVEVAQELGLAPKIACVYSEQDPAGLVALNRAGRISALPPLGPASDDLLLSCEHIVALMGPEPYMAALRGGAGIVLGGRTTDTAVLAAVPLMYGAGGRASVARGQGG